MSEFSGLWKRTKITGKHLYLHKQNAAAQVAEELKTVTYATPPMEERRKKERKDTSRQCNQRALI